MALPSSGEDEGTGKEEVRKTKCSSRKRKRLLRLRKLSASSKKRLSEHEVEEGLIESEYLRLSQEIESLLTTSEEEEEDMGVVEPRPPEVTSWKQVSLSGNSHREIQLLGQFLW